MSFQHCVFLKVLNVSSFFLVKSIIPLAIFSTYATLKSMINVEIERQGTENTAGLLRRFSRKSQSSGVVKRVRSIRYSKRKPSHAKIKLEALTRIKRTAEYIELFKMGREPQQKKRK